MDDAMEHEITRPTPSKSTRSHVTELPKGVIILRVLQFGFAIIVLGLTARASTIRDGIGLVEDSGLHVIIWMAAITSMILIWVITATYFAPRAYNYWAILGMEVFAIFMWLFGFIFMMLSSLIASRYVHDMCSSAFHSCGQPGKSYPLLTYVACAFSGAILVLYIASLTIVSICIRRHRAAGGHCKIGSRPPRFDREVHVFVTAKEEIAMTTRYA